MVSIIAVLKRFRAQQREREDYKIKGRRGGLINDSLIQGIVKHYSDYFESIPE